jgi:hypothetical protein
VEDLLYYLHCLYGLACHADDLLRSKALLSVILQPLEYGTRTLRWTSLHISCHRICFEISHLKPIDQTKIIPNLHPNIDSRIFNDSHHFINIWTWSRWFSCTTKVPAGRKFSDVWFFSIHSLANFIDNNKSIFSA